jgi:hypothetical protein
VPESAKSDISELQNLLDTMKGNLHAAPLISIERYSQKAQIDRIAIAYTERRAGSAPRAVASATQIESRTLLHAALIHTRSCNREHQLLTRIFN